jgi:hypothetical protein
MDLYEAGTVTRVESDVDWMKAHRRCALLVYIAAVVTLTLLLQATQVALH